MRTTGPYAFQCVGVIVLIGCLTLVIGPDISPSSSRETIARTRFPTIVIDAGHGGNDDGAKRAGVLEKNETLNVARHLEALLKEYGLPTVMTRDSDRYVSLADRVEIANRLEPAVFVSIHFNDSRDRSAEGVETYYSEEKVPLQEQWTWVGLFSNTARFSQEGETLAGFIQVALVARTNMQDRGIKSRRLYVIRNTRCPSVLIEAGFLSNSMERQMLSNDDYRVRLAAGIAAGIVEFVKNQPEYSVPVLASTNVPEN